MKNTVYLVVAIVISLAFSAQGNMLLNGGFENTNGLTADAWGGMVGDPVGWTFVDAGSAEPVLREDAYTDKEGTWMFKIGADNDRPAAGGSIYQDVSGIAVGVEHSLSFLIAAPKSMDISWDAKVYDKNGTDDYALNASTNVTATIVQDFEPCSLTFTPTNSTVRVEFVETSLNSSSNDPFLDDVQLVPEPATFGLLGFFGLVYLLRRKLNS